MTKRIAGKEAVPFVDQQKQVSIGVCAILLYHVDDTRQRVVGGCNLSAAVRVQILFDLSIGDSAIDPQYLDPVRSVLCLVAHQLDGRHSDQGRYVVTNGQLGSSASCSSLVEETVEWYLREIWNLR